MKPSVSRVVHFHGTLVTEDNQCEVSLPFAAIIANVNEDGTVNLFVIDRTGEANAYGGHQNIPYSEEPKPDHWSWPPRV